MFDKGTTMTTQRVHKATQITNLSLSIKILRELYSTDVHRTAQPNAKKNNCKISRNGAKVEVELDTGTDANVMDK